MISMQFPAGVTTVLSRAAKISNWQDSNLVRWEDGVTLRPVGGWEQIIYAGDPIASRVRKIHKWVTNFGVPYTAILCEQHCYIDTGNSLTDITPIGGMAPLQGDVTGYGELDYSEDTYGTPRTGVSTMQKFSPAWTLENWGEDLLVMTSYDGRLLKWSPATPTTKLVAVTGAPTNNRQFVVTPEHHCMIFGMGGQAGDIGWCSQEDLSDWNFASLVNTAGMYTVDPFSPIVSVHLSAAGILAFTPAMSHVLDYIGLPYVYRIRSIGKVPVPISAASIAPIPEGIVWVSVEGFWIYNGSSVNIIPCPVWDAVSTKMDYARTVRESHSVSLQNRGEIWWFWVDGDLGIRTSRYISLAYRSNVWAKGYLSRSCGMTYGNERNPIMSDGSVIWKHELGFQYTGAPYLPYLESQTLNMANGENWITISKILPDISGDRQALGFRLAKNNDRTNYATQVMTPIRVVNEYGWVDIRETARDVRLRIEMIANSDWQTVGPIIFDAKARGNK